MDLVQELAENHSYLNAISTLQQKPIKLSIPDASPSQVKAERAEETIGKVLEEPLGPFFFRKYLSSISCEYLLLFVQEFKQYRSIPKSAREYRLRFLSKIIHKYVKPVNGAEIPMGSLVKHSLLYYYNLIENDNDVTQSSEDVEKANLDTDSLLEELLEISVYQINRDLELSCFQSFIDSKFYRRLVAIRNHQIGILTLDSFLFLRVLGEGGFGRVHAVTKKDTNRAYACKILSKEKVLTKKREPLIKNEVIFISLLTSI